MDLLPSLRRRLVACLLVWHVGAVRVAAQEPVQPPGWDDWMLQTDREVSSEQSTLLLEEYQQAQAYSRLYKLDLNKADRQELYESGLFSAAEVEALLRHRNRFGPLLAWYELQAISLFTPQRLEALQVHCVVTSGHQRNSWRSSWQSADQIGLSRSDFSWPLAAGYDRARAADGQSHYAGSALGQRLQYRNQGLMHKAVLSISREPGELGFDRAGGHLQLHSNGRLKRLVLGDYHLQLGEGLVANTGFGVMRATHLEGYFFPGLQIKGASGLPAFGTYRGVVGQWRLTKRIIWVPWAFRMRWSSTQQILTDGTSSISSINKSGLHRTPTERGNRHNLPVWGWGTAVQFRHGNWQWIGGAQAFHLSIPLAAEQAFYKQLQPTGPNRWHISLAHQYHWKRLQWQGEWAWQGGGEMALVQQAYANLPGNLQWRMAYRHFTPGYHAFLANSLQRGSEVTNEKGWLINLQYQPMRKLSMAWFVDLYTHPWLRYRIDAPSNGAEQRLLLQWQADKSRRLIWQSRFETFERNQYTTTWVQTQEQRRMRHQLQFKEQINAQWEYAWQWNFNLFAPYETAWQKGNALWLRLRYQSEKWKFAAQFALFDAPDYDNRFFFMEPDVLYGAGMSQLSGTGQRFVLLMQYKRRRYDLWLRYAQMRLVDRVQLGSGLDELPGPIRHQLRFQFQWKHSAK